MLVNIGQRTNQCRLLSTRKAGRCFEALMPSRFHPVGDPCLTVLPVNKT